MTNYQAQGGVQFQPEGQNVEFQAEPGFASSEQAGRSSAIGNNVNWKKAGLGVGAAAAAAGAAYAVNRFVGRRSDERQQRRTRETA